MKRGRVWTSVVAVAVVACTAAAAGAAAGDLDSSFGTGGRVTTDFAGANEAALGVALQTDGKILAAGNTCVCVPGDFNVKFALARYNADGSPDGTLGGSGKVITDFGPGLDAASAVAVQTDGKIVVGGSSGGGLAALRYNADGTLDATFGTGGRAVNDFGGSGGQGNSVAIQVDGKIIVSGSAAGLFALARFNADGSPDASFGSSGAVTTDFGGGFQFAFEVAIQTDGKIVASGGANADFALARYNVNGTLDGTFGGGGLVTTDFGGGFEPAFGVDIQADGKIVAAGGVGDFDVARFNTDGSLDASFGGGGKTTTDFGTANDSAAAVEIQADGKIVAAGNGPSDFALARYNSDGSLDTSFGSGGKVTTDFGGQTDNGWDLVIQPDGKIVAAGNTYPSSFIGDFALARYSGGASAVLFAAFAAKLEISLGPGPSDDSFALNSTFTLGPASNGINPASEQLTLKIGTFSTIIPAGSFKQDKKGRFKFDGTIAGVSISAVIESLGGGRYSFKAEGSHANLTGTTNPVVVALTIGDDSGTTVTTAEIKRY